MFSCVPQFRVASVTVAEFALLTVKLTVEETKLLHSLNPCFRFLWCTQSISKCLVGAHLAALADSHLLLAACAGRDSTVLITRHMKSMGMPQVRTAE